MHIKTKATAISLVAASALVAGCGSSSKSASDQAQDICKNYNGKIKALPRPQSVSDLKTYIDKAAPLAQQGTVKLKGIKPPSDKTAQWNAWLATLSLQSAAIGQAKSQVDAGNIAGAVALVKKQQPISDKANAQAKALGLDACGGA